MKLENLLAQMGDAASARRVYAKPVQAEGVTVIPAALVLGGGGGGSDAQNGVGAGWGVYAMPVGAYVVRDGRVRFKPAVDLNWLALVVLMVLRIVLRHLRETR